MQNYDLPAMKTLFAAIKTTILSFLAYRALYYSFIFLISGMWIITLLLLILFIYLSRSIVMESVCLLKTYKSFKQSGWALRFSKPNFRMRFTKRFSSGNNLKFSYKLISVIVNYPALLFVLFAICNVQFVIKAHHLCR